MRLIGWLILLLMSCVQLLALFLLARWREPPLPDLANIQQPFGPNTGSVLWRLLQLRGVFPDTQALPLSEDPSLAGSAGLRAVEASGMPSSVDLRLASLKAIPLVQDVLSVQSGEELRREVNLGLRRMWAAYATWEAEPEFEPQLATALDAFGCRLALLACAKSYSLAEFCVERHFFRGRVGLLLIHPDSTGLQDVAVSFLPGAETLSVLARVSARVSGLLTAWQPSYRSKVVDAGEVGLLAELPAWPPTAPLMLAALSVEFHGRVRFWRRPLSDRRGSMKLTLLSPEQDYPLNPADGGTAAALRLLLSSIAPDTWRAGWMAAALLNFALLPLPSLLPEASFSNRFFHAIRMAVWCNLLLWSSVAALRLFFNVVWDRPTGLALAAAWRRIVFSELALRIRADWHLNAYPGAGLVTVSLMASCAFYWRHQVHLENPAAAEHQPSESSEPPEPTQPPQPPESTAGRSRQSLQPASQIPRDRVAGSSSQNSAPVAVATPAVAAAASPPAAAARDPDDSSEVDLDGSSSSLGDDDGGSSSSVDLGSSSDDDDDAEAAAARDADAAQNLELVMESLAAPSLWIPQRDPERCLSRLRQWTCRVTPPAAAAASDSTATATTDAEVAEAADSDDGWPRTALRASHCPVCLDRFRRGHQLVGLLCGHVFHRACAAAWLVRRSTCPICRRCAYGLPAPPAAATA